MKMIKTFMPLALAGAVFANGAVAEDAAAEESALAYSLTVSNMYLWRGQDLGNSGAVSGDLSYSADGFHTGIWVSSGDTNNEYDLWVGYGGEMGDFTYDVSLWTYVYPNSGVGTPGGSGSPDPTNDPGELSELILTVGYGDFSASYYDNIAGGTGGANNGYRYFTVSGQFDKFGVTVGNVDEGRGSTEANYTHADVTYSYNDNLSFTVSQVVDREDNAAPTNRANVQVSYSFPL